MLDKTLNSYGNDLSPFHIFLTLDNRNDLTAHYGALIPRQPVAEPAHKSHRTMTGLSLISHHGSFSQLSEAGWSSFRGVESEVGTVDSSSTGTSCRRSGRLASKWKVPVVEVELRRKIAQQSVESSVAGSGSRRSCRLRVKALKLGEKTVSREASSVRSSVGAGKVVETLRKGQEVSGEIPSSAAGSTSSAVPVFTGIGQTRKTLLAKKGKEELKALKKEFHPVALSEQVDILHDRLKCYHDEMLGKIDNVTTVRLSPEVVEVLKDVGQVDDQRRSFAWSKEDETRLNRLNEQVKELKPRDDWFWRSDKGYSRCQYNDKRMAFCQEKELVYKIIHCPQCKSTGLLVGLEQIDSNVCYDCLVLNNSSSAGDKKAKVDAWNKVRPESEEFPKRVERGFENEDLPHLYPGDKAVLAPVHPIVTVKKNYFANKQLRQESISIQQDPVPTWCKILPRCDLHNRFMIIDRTTPSHVGKKYVVASSQRVGQWLRYLFRNHREFIRMRENDELEMSSSAIRALDAQEELAEVLHDLEEGEVNESNAGVITQAEMESRMSYSECFSFDKYPYLYLKAKEFMRLRAEGKVEIVEGNEQERRPTYSSSANMAFPHLFPYGEQSPLDFHNYKLSRFLLKKQSLFAHTMSTGKYQWTFAQDEIYLMYQYARLVEQQIHANVGFYISQHPDIAHLPIDSVISAFQGPPDDQGLLDSRCPDLSTMMTQLPHSRERWFQERLGIEAISRDLGDPNLFLTELRSTRFTGCERTPLRTGTRRAHA